MRNTERTAVSLATCVATILCLVAIPIVTRGQTTGTASTPRPLTPLEQVWYSGSGDGYHYRLDFTNPDRCACVACGVSSSFQRSSLSRKKAAEDRVRGVP